jgi:Lrp/AsnC family transcriptional regulator, leucine-responsive regulatory protein
VKNLDLKDRKLMAYLAYHSRARLAELAKLVNLSKNSVNYRIERLLRLGYITKFSVLLDYEAIEYCTYDLFLRIKVKSEDEKKLIEYIKSHPSVLWAVKLLGEWDIKVEYVTDDFYVFYKTHLKEILEKFGEFIEDYEIKITTEKIKGENVLPEDIDLIKFDKPSLNRAKQRVHLDITDKKILNVLSQNSRASYQEIGKLIGESLETTRNRIKRLEKNVIEGYSAEFDYQKNGYTNYLIFLKLKNIFSTDKKRLEAHLQSKKEIHLALRNGNFPEVFLFTVTKTEAEVESLIKEIRYSFFNEVQRIQSILVTEVIKSDTFPEGLIN